MTEIDKKPANDNASASPTAKACPICGRAATTRFEPFCSGRCADVDLNRWLGGVYQIPLGPEIDEETERPGLDPDL